MDLAVNLCGFQTPLGQPEHRQASTPVTASAAMSGTPRVAGQVDRDRGLGVGVADTDLDLLGPPVLVDGDHLEFELVSAVIDTDHTTGTGGLGAPRRRDLVASLEDQDVILGDLG